MKAGHLKAAGVDIRRDGVVDAAVELLMPPEEEAGEQRLDGLVMQRVVG